MSSTSPATLDPLDSLLDLSEYDSMPAYQSPSMSPAASKTPFIKPESTLTSPTTATLPTVQPLTGPSHQYELYKQQTGMVPGAIASTLAVNNQVGGYGNWGVDYLSGLGTDTELFDFNAPPSQGSLDNGDIDMDFNSPANETSLFFGDSISPSTVNGEGSASLPSPPNIITPQTTSQVGRMWPGMHQQAAMAKAQAQRQQQMVRQNTAVKPKPKSTPPTDPIVEQKITQLLNSMRAKSVSSDGGQGSGINHSIARLKKDEDDMDEDERLLASEEGKKLSSKERRQLRNKVSARAFRSRRKEYITQLEAEISNKVTENGDLRAQNRALVDENKRLSDLTRMLLSSSSFSNFLDQLSSNPTVVQQQVPQPAPVEQIQRQPEQTQQQQRSMPKDVNPFLAQQQVQQQRIGMAMIPEPNIDFSTLNLDADPFSFQPQVYAVLETPEVTFDSSLLSDKASNFVGPSTFEADDEVKRDMPVIERPPVAEEKQQTVEAAMEKPELAKEPEQTEEVFDDEFESDPAFALYHSTPSTTTAPESRPAELDVENLSDVEIFGGIESEKVLARYELVDASTGDAAAALSMARVQRISARLESVMSRLEMLTLDL